MEVKMMDNKRLEKWKLKTKGIFHKITYDEFWFYIDDLMTENKKLTNNWNKLEEWLEKQRIRNSEWENFVQKDTRLGIPIGYLLDKMKEIKEGNNVSDRD